MSKTEILAQYLACGLSISSSNTSSPWKKKHNKKYKALWSRGRCPVSVDTHSRHCFPFICNVADAFQNERFPSRVLYPRLLITYRKSDFHLHWPPLRPQVQLKCNLSWHGSVDQSQPESGLLWEITTISSHRNALQVVQPPDFLYILHVWHCKVLEPGPLYPLKLRCNGTWFVSITDYSTIIAIIVMFHNYVITWLSLSLHWITWGVQFSHYIVRFPYSMSTSWHILGSS